jgi:hypothetical protein
MARWSHLQLAPLASDAASTRRSSGLGLSFRSLGQAAMACLAGLAAGVGLVAASTWQGTGGHETSTAEPAQAPPVISRFEIGAHAAPEPEALLVWRVDGAADVHLERRERPSPAGPTDVLERTEYVLTARNPAGSASRTLQVYVARPPVIETFAAEPATVRPGQAITLRWQTARAQRLYLGDAPLEAPAGALEVRPERPGEFVLRVENAAGEAIRRVQIAFVATSTPVPTPRPAPTPVPTPAVTPTPVATRVAPTATPQRTQPLLLGFQAEGFHAPGRPQVIQLTKAAGFTLLKQQVRWADLEPQRGQFAPATLAALDALIADYHQAGLQVLLSVVAAPPWAALPGGHAPQDPADLEHFLRRLLGRYRGQVQYLECWNEANLATEWGPGRLWPDGPHHYVELLAACFRAARAVDPALQVILGALTPTGVGECLPTPEQCTPEQLAARRIAIDDVQYLQALYAVQGGRVRQLFDLLGVHPGCYNNDPTWTPTLPPLDEQQRRKPAGFHGHWSFYFGRLDQLRGVLEQAGDGGKGMAITEFGCATSAQPAPGYEYARDNSEADQAAYLVRAIELARQRPWVRLFVVWNLNYRVVVPPTDEKYAFGIVREDWTPLPAYLVLKAMPK